ncbi:hypothetical protein B0H19DRAFT_1079119 [Mycena capillaripes]|nr:hypothetical protein B0H19DRAFT_1079119 [Mycena capillaripes]
MHKQEIGHTKLVIMVKQLTTKEEKLLGSCNLVPALIFPIPALFSNRDFGKLKLSPDRSYSEARTMKEEELVSVKNSITFRFRPSVNLLPQLNVKIIAVMQPAGMILEENPKGSAPASKRPNPMSFKWIRYHTSSSSQCVSKVKERQHETWKTEQNRHHGPGTARARSQRATLPSFSLSSKRARTSDFLRIRILLQQSSSSNAGIQRGESFRSITRSYYRGAAGCLLVHDLTSRPPSTTSAPGSPTVDLCGGRGFVSFWGGKGMRGYGFGAIHANADLAGGISGVSLALRLRRGRRVASARAPARAIMLWAVELNKGLGVRHDLPALCATGVCASWWNTDVLRAPMVLVAHCSPLVAALSLNQHDSLFGKSHLDFDSALSRAALSPLFTFPLDWDAIHYQREVTVFDSLWIAISVRKTSLVEVSSSQNHRLAQVLLQMTSNSVSDALQLVPWIPLHSQMSEGLSQPQGIGMRSSPLS